VEFTLVNPRPGRNRKGRFVSKTRHNAAKARPRRHKRKRSRGGTRSNPPPAIMLVPPPVLNPRKGGRRRYRRPGASSGGLLAGLFGRKRRNPSDGPMDFVSQGLPILGGVWLGMNMIDRVPKIGGWLSSPIGTGVAAYVVDRFGPRIFGDSAGPLALGLLVAAGLKALSGRSLMGDPMEGREHEAIHAVSMDGIEGYFVPSGMEGAFEGPIRRHLPPMRPHHPHHPPPALPPPPGVFDPDRDGPEGMPPGVPPAFWATLPPPAREQIRDALRQAARRGGGAVDQILASIREKARARGLIGDMGDIADMLDRELRAA
jgi:hypothetical protein